MNLTIGSSVTVVENEDKVCLMNETGNVELEKCCVAHGYCDNVHVIFIRNDKCYIEVWGNVIKVFEDRSAT